MSQLFATGGQSIGASALASVLPINFQDWFPFGWTGLSSLLSKGLSRVLSSTTVQKHQFFGAQPSLRSNPCKMPTVLTLQYCVGSSGSFASPHHQFVDICKLISWDFDWDCIESIDQVGKNWHFDNLESPYSSTWNVSPLSLISFISFVVFLI